MVADFNQEDHSCASRPCSDSTMLLAKCFKYIRLNKHTLKYVIPIIAFASFAFLWIRSLEVIYSESSGLHSINFVLLSDSDRSTNDKESPASVEGTVHIIWCRDSFFEYRHYLSVMSVVKHLQPSNIVFHAISIPKVDKYRYYLWFDEIKQRLPNFAVMAISPNHACMRTIIGCENSTRFGYITEERWNVHGEDIMLKDFPFEAITNIKIFHTLKIGTNNANELVQQDGIIVINRNALESVKDIDLKL